MVALVYIMYKKTNAQQAVWQNGGFGAFLEGKVLNQSSGIFSNFGAEKPPLRQAAGRYLICCFARTKSETRNLLFTNFKN